MRFKQWLITETGSSLSADEVLQYVRKIHSNESDFEEGDLADRIMQFPMYNFVQVPVSKISSPWSVYEPEAQEYAAQYSQGSQFPPIVLDPDLEVIDGSHRVAAAKIANLAIIPAYVASGV